MDLFGPWLWLWGVLAFTVVGGAVMAAPFAMLWVVLTQKIAEKRDAERELLASGELAPATITHLEEHGSRRSRLVGVTIALEVSPAEGAPFTAKVQRRLGVVELLTVQPGRAVEVRYDPLDVGQITIVGLPAW